MKETKHVTLQAGKTGYWLVYFTFYCQTLFLLNKRALQENQELDS